jgi:hypothetical protein
MPGAGRRKKRSIANATSLALFKLIQVTKTFFLVPKNNQEEFLLPFVHESARLLAVYGGVYPLKNIHKLSIQHAL